MQQGSPKIYFHYKIQDDKPADESLAALLTLGPWPPAVGEHLATRTLMSRPKICEFLGFVTRSSVAEGNLRVKIYQEFTLDVPNNLSLWQDSDCNEYIIEKESILPVRPQIEVVPSLSRKTRSGRQIVFQVENFDVIESIISNKACQRVPDHLIIQFCAIMFLRVISDVIGLLSTHNLYQKFIKIPIL